MMAPGFNGPETVSRVALEADRNPSTAADNASANHNQAGCRLLLVFGLGDSAGRLVDGVASVQNWSSLPD
jgi:hypothetical protein